MSINIIPPPRVLLLNYHITHRSSKEHNGDCNSKALVEGVNGPQELEGAIAKVLQQALVGLPFTRTENRPARAGEMTTMTVGVRQLKSIK